MHDRRALILVVAVVLAGLTAFATFSYASSADQRAQAGTELVELFVVKKDIIKGFSGDKALDDGYIGKTKMPRKFYPAKALVNAQSLRGKVAVAPLAAGLPVVESAFVEPRVARESFAQRIDAGMQAVTVSVSDVQGVARLLVPGDRVNLLVTTVGDEKDPNGKLTGTVLQNIEILAVGNSTELQPGEQAPEAPEGQAGKARTTESGLITLSVPALDAERVVHAAAVGTIHMTLVPPDFKPAPVPPVNRGNLFA
jgi:pilus assembly protein CpaB